MHRVRCGTETLSLTVREFGLLEFLMRHVGQAMRRGAILDAVWDPHYEGDTRGMNPGSSSAMRTPKRDISQ